MTVAELDTKPLLEVRGLKMHFPVTDLTRTVRPHLCETRRHSRLALGRGYRGDRRDIRQILLDYLFSFGRRSGRLCGMRADNFLAGPPLLVLDRCLRTPSRLSVRHLSSATAERPFTRAVPEVRIRFPPAESPRLAGFCPPTARSRLFARGCGPGRCSAVSRDGYRAVHGADRREYLCRAKFQYRGVDAAVA